MPEQIQEVQKPAQAAANAAALAPAANPRKQYAIADLLKSDQFRQAVHAALPKHLTPERFVRIALNATMRNPDLLLCTQESFFRAMLDLSALGLEPDGRRAHLIPFKNNKTNKIEVQLIIDYKGLVELVRRSGDVSYIHADVVYQGDQFKFGYGTDCALRHVPNFDRPENAKPLAVYSFVKLKDDSEDFMVLSFAEVEKVRKRSKSPDKGPWLTDWAEMAKKTAFRRHSKWLPLSPETRDAVEKDDGFAGGDIEIDALADPSQGVAALTDGRTAELREKLESAKGNGAADATVQNNG